MFAILTCRLTLHNHRSLKERLSFASVSVKIVDILEMYFTTSMIYVLCRDVRFHIHKYNWNPGTRFISATTHWKFYLQIFVEEKKNKQEQTFIQIKFSVGKANGIWWQITRRKKLVNTNVWRFGFMRTKQANKRKLSLTTNANNGTFWMKKKYNMGNP